MMQLRFNGKMIYWLLMLVALFAAGCGGEQGDAASNAATVEGPAFVLFFTDP